MSSQKPAFQVFFCIWKFPGENRKNSATVRSLILIVCSCFAGQAPIKILQLYGMGHEEWRPGHQITLKAYLELVSFTNNWLRVLFVALFNEHIRDAMARLVMQTTAVREGEAHRCCENQQEE